MAWEFIQTDGKSTLYSNDKNSLLFRHGSVKPKKAIEPSHEIKMAKLELACLKAINQLPEEDKEEAIDELEEALEEDEETELEEKRKEENEPKKKKFDDPEDALFKSEQSRATVQPKYSALEYKVGSLGFEQVGENGDQLMLDLGCY